MRSWSRRKGRVLSFCLALSGALTCRAATETSTLRAKRDSTSKQNWGAQAEGAVKFEFTQYMTPLEENPRLNETALMQGDLRLELKTQATQSKVDFSAGKYLDLHNSFYSVQEIYTSRNFDGNEADLLTLSVGRKLEFWSQVDNDWQLGLWEPQFNLDSIRPVAQGLTGFFAKGETGDFEMLAYGSPIFIPTMGPDISEKEGALVSESRWYKTPAPSGEVLGRENVKYVYDLSVPDIGKLITNPGGGLRLRYGGREPGFWSSVNFARKPVNALLIKYDYNLALQNTGSQAEIAVSPVVAYHLLYGADLGWRFEKGSLSASFLRDEPGVDLPVNDVDSQGDARTDWIQQDPGDSKIYAAHADARWEMGLTPVEVSLDYLRAEESETRDRGADGRDRGALLPTRLNFTNAAAVKTTVSSVFFQRPLTTSLRYLREFDQRGSLWTLITQYSLRRDWVLQAGVDVLGVDDTAQDNTDPHFLNQFRANDREFGGMSYVF